MILLLALPVALSAQRITPEEYIHWKAKKYTVQEGETLRDVALRFAVKPEKILKKNGLKEGAQLVKGQELWLR